MKPYSEFRPTRYDTAGLGLPDRQDWLVVDIGRNRDADCLTESNWDAALARIEACDSDGEDHEVHRFGHWGPGWFEIILVRPNSAAAKEAEAIGEALDAHPVLDEDDLSEREIDEAAEVWTNCYSDADRIAYIRDNRRDFEFHSFADMLSCARGHYFAGSASELLYS